MLFCVSQFYIPTNNVEGSPFLTPSPILVISEIPMMAILTSVWWYLIMEFDLHFSVS